MSAPAPSNTSGSTQPGDHRTTTGREGGSGHPTGDNGGNGGNKPKVAPKVEPKDNSKNDSRDDSKNEPKAERFRLKVFKLEATDPPATDEADGEGESNPDKSDDKVDGKTDKTDDKADKADKGKEEKAKEEKEKEEKAKEERERKERGKKDSKKKTKDDDSSKSAASPNGRPLTIIEYNDTEDAFKKTTLGKVRTKVAPVMSKAFRFCDASGIISQDGTTLSSYLADLNVSIKPGDAMNIYVTEFDRPKTSAAELLDNPPFVLKFVQKLKDDEVQKESTLHSSSLPKVEGGSIKLKEIRQYVKAMSASASRHQFCLEDGHTVDDEMTLKEYVASLTKTIEKDETPQATPSIEIYFCKPGITQKSKSKGASEEVKAAAQKPSLELTEINAQRDKQLREMKEELDAANFKLEGAQDDARSAGVLTEDEWDLVIRNCNLMSGWIVDLHNNKVVRAPKAAFQLRKGLNMGAPPVLDEPEKPPANADSSTTPPTTKPAEARITAPEKARGIPNFAIDDDSSIEVTMTSHEFQESMAKSHFSATSVEAEVSGGFGAFSASVSAGYSQQSSSEEKSSTQNNEKVMIGTYRFPRATVHLTPNDLEPTPELEAAIKRIRARKNILDLRQLHRDFGHLFCRKVVIGGCLQTTKIITMSTQTSEKAEKSQFKASVGAAVQTPWVSASLKTSHEKGDASDSGKTTTDTKEKMVFEATGGNTIFASDTKLWTLSVANHKNWRVIEQDALSSLADAISEIPGHGDAPMWFMQAVPSLSKYIQIPRSRTLNVRFKAVLNEHAEDALVGSDEFKYLGHNSTEAPVFIHRRLKPRAETRSSYLGPPHDEKGKLVVDLTATMEPEDAPSHDPLFSPKSDLIHDAEVAKARVAKAEAAKKEFDTLTAADAEVKSMKDKTLETWAAALMQHLGRLAAAKREADDLAGAQQAVTDAEKAIEVVKEANDDAIKKFSSEFKNTVWRLEVPDGSVLAHEARVSVRSLAVEPNPTLSVYRNAQGVYLPMLTSYDGPCFWRILKRDPASRTGDPIRDGDEVRLSWMFSDQADGFRDFFQDTFGRRRFTQPDGAGDVLYFKVPYPPIQSSSTDIALVLSSAETRKPIVDTFKTLPKGSKYDYNLHDLSFRIDSAGDNGMGESMDYMAPVVESQEVNKNQISWGLDRAQFTVPELFVASILLPGIRGPLAGSMLGALLL